MISTAAIAQKKVQRNYILGDSWLYYKIYTGHKTSDVVLTEVIKPVVEKLKEKGVIDKWFFIRYADTRHHVRVRLHYSNTERVGEIINGLYPYLKQFMDQDLIWKIQLDTYQREIERYGEPTMELSEAFFHCDSKMIVDFLDLIEGEEGEMLRWLFSLRAMDSHLNDFGYLDYDKLRLLDRLKTGFGNEFGMSRPLKKQLDSKYREERKKIEEFMSFDATDQPDYAPILNVIHTKEKEVQPLALQILECFDEGIMELRLDDLMASYLHMHMNRLFKSKNRVHELVCYDFLYRYYKSMIARNKYQKK
ncbi:thiopeptide-type bacteriocin biosynthesis protein [Ulvibacterium sp.]|uniref:thiopeptide-type bacteriocin biosynthesis protein n=1 Tax=Ulvibacterium sp. TaxID=2665914 RepID=UPI002606AD3F|nr:thiopeptide-type bacteriocin biosynthesis protein [Ulvibacterium sp.]